MSNKKRENIVLDEHNVELLEKGNDYIKIAWSVNKTSAFYDNDLRFRVTYKEGSWPDPWCTDYLKSDAREYLLKDLLASTEYHVCVHALHLRPRVLELNKLRKRSGRPKPKPDRTKRCTDQPLGIYLKNTNRTLIHYDSVEYRCITTETPKWVGHMAWTFILAALLALLFLCCCVMLSRWIYRRRRRELKAAKYAEAMNGAIEYPQVDENEILKIYREPTLEAFPRQQSHDTLYDEPYPAVHEAPPPPIEHSSKVKSYVTIDFPRHEPVPEPEPTPPPTPKKPLRFIYTENPDLLTMKED